jgi:hypothetical protein
MPRKYSNLKRSSIEMQSACEIFKFRERLKCSYSSYVNMVSVQFTAEDVARVE